jgi:hypothetical protein
MHACEEERRGEERRVRMEHARVRPSISLEKGFLYIDRDRATYTTRIRIPRPMENGDAGACHMPHSTQHTAS